ncbi:MAG: hypothetical protein IJ087_20005 [Eggerthellaceae bacterium]|nr:hypothetical protein [Eggerthellaceae bacterium]
MTIRIAKSRKTLAHYFIRIVDADSARDMSDDDIAALVNDLSSAKGHKQLASAIEHACLLFETRGEEKQPRRVMTPAECSAALEAEFEPVDARKLAYEMYMASPKELRANSSKDSPAAVLDAYGRDLAGDLSALGDDSLVLVEPVQDWMTFRNMLTLGAALLANIENLPEGGRVLERAGFFEPGRSSYDFKIFAAPFKLQSAFLFEFGKHPIKSGGMTTFEHDYLYALYQSQSELIKHRGGLSPVVIHGLDPDGEVFIATHYDAVQGGISPIDIAKIPVEEDRNLYLCVKKRGSQYDMAKRVVTTLWGATQNLVDRDGSLLGMTQDSESLFLPQQGSITYTFHSLISKAWNALCFHEGRRLIACKRCGCGVLASNRGPAKEYCSESCRIQDRE